MRIIPIIEGESYDVESDSGKTYRVEYCGSGDADPDYVATWSCTCPAYQFNGKLCKHIHAVVDHLDAIDEEEL